VDAGRIDQLGESIESVRVPFAVLKEFAKLQENGSDT
jgi:hypothetical protein